MSLKESFIEKANKVHNGKYDYSKVDYVNSQTKVCIICPEHGEFTQIPSSHSRGYGCPKCRYIKSAKNNTKTFEWFVEKAIKIHGNKYDYSKTKYINTKNKICIICPEHGEFWQTPANHLQGNGCPKCKNLLNSNEKDNMLSSFIEKSNKIHNNKYIYTNVEYVNARTKVCIICPEHGEFWQTPHDHLDGHSCPKCGKVYSKAEDEIIKIIGNDRCIQHNRNILYGKELDIYIPEKKLAIEYNGLRWHTEEFNKDKNYHVSKLNECNKKGIKLLQIFEDEWVNKEKIVIDKLHHILHLKEYKIKIPARKCVVKTITSKEARHFLSKNHIQGYVNATIYLGLFYNNEIIAVMTFIKEANTKWNLNRFATNIEYNCVGAGGKLFKYFIRNYNYNEIKSFADRRWTTNENDNLYTKLGFELSEILKPDYTYYHSKTGLYKRIHKFNFRKDRLHKKYGLPLTMTEKEMCNEIGAYRIWDCGLLKYVYKNKGE